MEELLSRRRWYCIYYRHSRPRQTTRIRHRITGPSLRIRPCPCVDRGSFCWENLLCYPMDLYLVMKCIIIADFCTCCFPQSLMADEQIGECPIMILGNKIDKNGAASEDEIRHYFGLHGRTTGRVSLTTISIIQLQYWIS